MASGNPNGAGGPAFDPGNDPVFKVLYKPEGAKPELDIVFFHGLQLGDWKDAWKNTWVTEVKGQDPVLWPREWLGMVDFPNARVLSASYDTQAFKRGNGGRLTVEQIAEHLVEHACFLLDDRIGAGERHVILVGHSLGGIILKAMVIEANKKAGLRSDHAPGAKDFVSNVRGAFFFATPHAGSRLAGFAEGAFGLIGRDGPVLEFLQVLGESAAEVNNTFTQIDRPNIRNMLLYALCEMKPYKKLMIVEKASAMSGMNTWVEMQGEDHISISKPASPGAEAYKHLVCYIKARQEEATSPAAGAPAVGMPVPLPPTREQLQEAREFDARYSAPAGGGGAAGPPTPYGALKFFKAKEDALRPEHGDMWAAAMFADFEAAGTSYEEIDKNRRALMALWDHIVEAFETGTLHPSFFDSKWARRGAEYRELVEPVDIANYYYRNLHTGPKTRGHYADGVADELKDRNRKRPSRYRVLQAQEAAYLPDRRPATSMASARALRDLAGGEVDAASGLLVGAKPWDEIKSGLLKR